MNAHHPFSPSRRLHLSALAAIAISGCATRGPIEPTPIPERVGLLPIEEYGEVGLYYSSTSKSVVGALTGGLGRLVMYGSEKERSKDFTARLAAQKLSASTRLRTGVLTTLAAQPTGCVALDDLPRSRAAIKAWKFADFKSDADAIVYLTLDEVAYSALSQDALWPKISATMTMISTHNEEEIGSATYQIRIDPDTSDPRDLTPLKRNRFSSAEQLLGESARAAQALGDDLDRLVALIAKDIATLKRGDELNSEAV